ncbi:MAG TPA: DUF1080 domain-containing protein [Flavisolibacter sp.]|jgi:hypothetical protein|nr:DUF1080 domain-containing protein [Flavisolibacter sp.]
MNKLFLFSLLLLTGLKQAFASGPAADSVSIEGRWDITINMNGKPQPSWLEVRHSGHRTLVGDFVGTGGSARPVSQIHYTGGRLSFAIPPQWESGNGDLVVEGEAKGAGLAGTITFPDGKQYNWTAERAPSLKREKPPVWGSPIRLFNGKDLTGWRALGKENQWQAKDGILFSPKSGSNLATDATFTDFKLHIEFRYPKGSNSGVYLRGRHEVQIEDSKGNAPSLGGLGAVYGFIAPSSQAAKAAGEWQSYDITLVGRMLTLVVNGETVICNREIPGITGGALDSREGEPGPFYLQGDHGPIEYRNIILTPAR